MVYESNEINLIKLQDGGQGIPGDSLYTWVKYSQYADGTDLTDDPTDAVYIGIAYNQKDKEESKNKDDYTWSKIKGEDGEDGTSVIITSTSITYQASSSGTTTPTGTWSLSVPSVENGQYLWTKTVVTYSDGKSTTAYSVAYKGTNGNDGTSSYTHIRYSANADGSSFVLTPTSETKYIGVYTGTSSSAPESASSYSWSKYVGDKGATGNGINSITYYYATTTTQTAPLPSNITSTSIPTLSATNKYLWQKEVIDYTDSSVADKTSVILLAVYGDTGDTGVGISSVDVWYAQSDSSTTAPTSDWVTTAPTWVDGKYIWTKTITTFTNDTTKESTPICITGSTGSTGIGVTSITEEYYLSTSKTEQPEGSWTTTPPTWTSDKYVWTRSKIVYTDGTIEYTTPICDSSWEAVNEIQVGGRNLFLSSKNLSKFSLSSPYLTVTRTNDKATITVNTSASSNHGLIFEIPCGNLEPNTDYTFSVYVNDYSNLNRIPHFSIGASDSSSIWSGITGGYIQLVKGYNSVTFNTEEHTGKFRFFVGIYLNNVDSYLTVSNAKLEKGNKATDWTPAPEDVESSINNQIGGANLASISDSTSNYAIATNYTYPCSLSSLFRTTKLIPASEGDIFTISTNINAKLSFGFFNESKVCISNIPYTNVNAGTDYYSAGWYGTYTAPVDTKYIAASWERTADGHIKLEKGAKVTEWNPAIEDIQESGYNLVRYDNIVQFGSGTMDKSNFISSGEIIRYDNASSGGFTFDKKSCYEPSTSYVLSGYITVISGTATNFNIFNGKSHSFISFEIDGVSYSNPFVSNSSQDLLNILNDNAEHYFILKYETATEVPDDDYTAFKHTYFQLNYRDTTVVKYKVRGFNLQKGFNPTPWSPAPADVQQQISEVKVEIDGLTEFKNSAENGGSTVIDGAAIKTGTITADQIDVEKLFSKEITATNFNITGGSIHINTANSEDESLISLYYNDNVYLRLAPNAIEMPGLGISNKMFQFVTTGCEINCKNNWAELYGLHQVDITSQNTVRLNATAIEMAITEDYVGDIPISFFPLEGNVYANRFYSKGYNTSTYATYVDYSLSLAAAGMTYFDITWDCPTGYEIVQAIPVIIDNTSSWNRYVTMSTQTIANTGCRLICYASGAANIVIRMNLTFRATNT